MNNLVSYCGLVDAKIRASDKDLLVQISLQKRKEKSTKLKKKGRTIVLLKPHQVPN